MAPGSGRPCAQREPPEGTHLKLKSSTACPLSFSPPFVQPWGRAMPLDTKRRLASWCAQVLPGIAVEFTEWVGADPRHPIHAVLVSFPSRARMPSTLQMKAEDIEPYHFVQALQGGDCDDTSALDHDVDWRERGVCVASTPVSPEPAVWKPSVRTPGEVERPL